MTTIRKPIRLAIAGFAALALSVVINPGVSSAATKTKTVCKTVKGKRVCTKVKVKVAKKKSAATDTTIAHSADTTVAK